MLYMYVSIIGIICDDKVGIMTTTKQDEKKQSIRAVGKMKNLKSHHERKKQRGRSLTCMPHQRRTLLLLFFIFFCFFWFEMGDDMVQPKPFGPRTIIVYGARMHSRTSYK